MKSTLIALTAVILFLLNGPAFGASKSVQHDIELKGIRHIDISHSVGNIRIVRTSGSEAAELTGVIKGRSKGWFRGTKDVTNIDFDISKQGDTLYIVFDQKNTEANFTLTIPILEQLTINLGVGNVSAVISDSESEINIGVGNAALTASLHAMGSIAMDTGVGNTHISGTNNQNTTRAIVTSSVHGKGEGNNSLGVNIGVGNSNLKLGTE